MEKEKPFALKNENLPAYPTEFSYADEDFTGAPIINRKKYAGITKREFFASQALSGFLAKHGAVDFTQNDTDRIIDAVDMVVEKLTQHKKH